MYKEVIKNATPKQFYENVSGRLYTLSLNQTGGVECNMYCFKKDIEAKDKKIANLEAKLEIKLEELHIAYCGIENVKTKNGNLKAEVKELKQQLAETDKLMQEYLSKCLSLEQQLAEKDKEISQLYPFVKEHNNGNFIEYNVVYEKNGIVATTTFGRNKEVAYDYLNLLKKGK